MVQHLASCPMTVSLSQMLATIGFHSSHVSTCVVPRTHTCCGDRAFQVAARRLWNSLPASLRQSDTTGGQFKKLLKTHLFRLRRISDCCFYCAVYKYFLLLLLLLLLVFFFFFFVFFFFYYYYCYYYLLPTAATTTTSASSRLAMPGRSTKADMAP